MNVVIGKLNGAFEIIDKGKLWLTTLRGHKIKMEMRYSEKLKSNMLLSYEVK
ncbi:MAG: hypothetical protein WKF91_06940 [Segetibacter sp.]